MTRKNRSFLLLAILCTVYFIVFKIVDTNQFESGYIPIQPIATHNNGDFFSGSTVCSECHLDIYTSHLETAHYNSSGKANIEKVKGSFKTHQNSLKLNDSVAFKMNVRNNVLYQDVFWIPKDSLVHSTSFDVFVGSGIKGQTYLNWQDSALYQLQVSYSTLSNNWINSPGYPTNRLASTRPIFERCLECHLTYAKSTKNFSKRNVYEKSKMMYGIDCERCHGPSYNHVTFHKENPKVSIPKNIQVFSDLTRQQKLDACALCHSGIRTESNINAFSFMIGDTLKRFSTPDYDEKSLKNLDVHGNQYGLLAASECFKESKKMDCTTCHNPHENQRDDQLYFNKKCLGCHSESMKEKANMCSENAEQVNLLDNNCITCHMPLAPSNTMRIEIAKDTFEQVKVRTHLIGIYVDSLLGTK